VPPWTVRLVRHVDQGDHVWYTWSHRGPAMIVNVSEAKAKLSKLLDMVYHGERVTIAKNTLPVADLVPHRPAGRRKLGLLRGKITVPDDFLQEDEEINRMFYGDER
jgi:prevent-host-death family protein